MPARRRCRLLNFLAILVLIVQISIAGAAAVGGADEAVPEGEAAEVVMKQ